MPAIRLGSARCTTPEISDSQGNNGRFMNLLFQFYYIHCAMVITLSFIICFVLLCFFKQGEKLTKEGVDNSWLLFIAHNNIICAHDSNSLAWPEPSDLIFYRSLSLAV